MNITVFCSAYSLDEKYTAPAAEFARLLGEGGHTLVWGGSHAGLMGLLADGVKEAGGRLVGISVEFLAHKTYEGADELVMTRDLAERKAQLLARADALVVLVGGLGTLDEITEVLELKKHALHDKPVVVLDTEGFYGGLRTQLERMDVEGFLPRPLAELITFAAEPAEALALLEEKS
ncbi:MULTISPECIES: TIGR00730 family Rossman fold protein [unclassified Kitasatospora]|uniref:LOG family protein n=1 Tax=unclassified Kitasatospora TaxID=2633591 RepID=UPI00070FD6D4|nr:MULTISPECIES: TIGR00730 family Rossman fold protein [unclassified Kitasatospora]KQV17362.1 lysine decarboxylase [Kitasatospora sp. Root107]KRB65547.1 lysine decarboxylase [Kitasatospora sp. Root187]